MGTLTRTSNGVLWFSNIAESRKQDKKLLKVDTYTTSTTRGRYARICIEVTLEKSLKTDIHIGTHKQVLLYEGLNLLCTRCGRFGHASWSCQFSQTPPLNSIPTTPTNSSHPSSPTSIPSTKESEWKTVSFPKRTNARYSKYQQRRQTDEPHNLQLADQMRKGEAVDTSITQVTPGTVTNPNPLLIANNFGKL